jgi:hypothetical protein
LAEVQLAGSCRQGFVGTQLDGVGVPGGRGSAAGIACRPLVPSVYSVVRTLRVVRG